MDSDDALIDALRRVIEIDDSPSLKLRLAAILAEASPDEALALVVQVLTVEPTHVEALEAAAAICRAVGDERRAAAYALLFRAARAESDRTAAGVESAGAPVVGEQPREHAPDTDADEPIAVPADLGELESIWMNEPGVVEPEIGELTRPGVRLADVAGLDDVKRQLELSYFAPLRHPTLADQFATKAGGGLLLWGPPGCGKTFIARAIAGELGADFYSVGIADVLDMWVGSSERNLSGIFRYARSHAPCVLFFDELDALGQKRSGLRVGGAAMRNTVNQLLAELDGAGTDNAGVFVLGATNHPWDLDEALLRPGRFGQSIVVLPPDAAAREHILRLQFEHRPTAALPLKSVVKATEGWSGADLVQMCDSASELALAASIAAGDLVPIDAAHLERAMRGMRSSMDPWFETARNYVAYANNDGRFDGLAAYLKRRR